MIENQSIETDHDARQPRRWLRWGVLAILFLASVVVAWRTFKLSAAPQETEIVPAIIRENGVVRFEDGVEDNIYHAPYRDNENDNTVVSVVFDQVHPSQTLLSELVKLPKLTKLYVWSFDSMGLESIGRLRGLEKLSFGSKVEGRIDFKPLTQLHNLSSLGFTATPLDEQAMEEIGTIHSLERLFLCGTGATDAGLKSLVNLTNLKDLLVWSPDITDDGLKYLGSMTQLTKLNISGNRLTSAGLKNLESLPNLKEFDISGKNISSTAAKELQKKLVSRSEEQN